MKQSALGYKSHIISTIVDIWTVRSSVSSGYKSHIISTIVDITQKIVAQTFFGYKSHIISTDVDWETYF